MTSVVIVLCLSVALLCMAAGNKGGRRLDRIEDRLEEVEDRQDRANIARREDVAELSLRMDEIETHVNNSATGLVSFEPQQSTKDDSQISNELLVVQKAFAEEKSRWRRDASEMENKLKQDVNIVLEKIDMEMKTEIQSLQNSNNDIKTSLEKSEREVKTDIESLQNSINDIKTSLEKSEREVKTDIESLQNSINDIKTGLEKSEREVKTDIESLQNSINDIKTGLEKSEREVKTDIQSLQNSTNAIRDNVLGDIKDTLESTEETCSQNSISLPLVLDKLSDMEKLMEETVSKVQKLEPSFTSCLEIYRSGWRTSGVFDIQPAPGMHNIPVYCDMTTDGGGWTVFERRRDGSEDFFRGWQNYAEGFGQFNGEFWLGNQHISSLTSTCCHELRIDLEDFEGNRAFAKYNNFQVLPLEDNFRLEVSGYSGTAGDALSYHSGYEFTTKDRDNDKRGSSNCAQQYSGAWWYNNCHYSNLNGLYMHGVNTSGVAWYHWKNQHYSLKFTEMKFRPN